MVKTQRFEIRASETEKKSWEEAAGGSRLVSSWARQVLNAAVEIPEPVRLPKEMLGTPGSQKCKHVSVAQFCYRCGETRWK